MLNETMERILCLFVITVILVISHGLPLQGDFNEWLEPKNFTSLENNYIDHESLEEVSPASTTTTTLAPPVDHPASAEAVESQNSELLEALTHCARDSDTVLCLKEKLIQYLDNVISSDNVTWLVGDYISLRKDPSFIANQQISKMPDVKDVDEILKTKLQNLVESRTIQLRLLPEEISNVEEGRKKKGGKKHGNMMMLFGVVVLAMIKQMVLGKIAFLALAAFMLAKVSLLFSSLSVLKKALGGQQKSEHVVVTSEHSGHSSGSGGGWQRSMQEEEDDDRNYRRRHHKPYRGYSDFSMEGA